jgi:Na+-transporting methylmalonyl-CoA/oxaloacetate decarboxylase gamma subunit
MGACTLLATTLALITLATTLIAMGTAFVLAVAVAVAIAIAGISQQRWGACNQRQAGKHE